MVIPSSIFLRLFLPLPPRERVGVRVFRMKSALARREAASKRLSIRSMNR